MGYHADRCGSADGGGACFPAGGRLLDRQPPVGADGPCDGVRQCSRPGRRLWWRLRQQYGNPTRRHLGVGRHNVGPGLSIRTIAAILPCNGL